ncbi:hypothetical protein WJX72_007147 [[Myrmecia] bisecta]|uniref:Uncharacterized protein n=1 Tax=[Myrmecia] bisecta TaxID=41462 RepID=A0AAW1R794_9CHLO
MEDPQIVCVPCPTQLEEEEQEGLVCRFCCNSSESLEAPAFVQDGVVTCTKPQGLSAGELRFRVQNKSGKVLFDRSGNETDEENRREEIVPVEEAARQPPVPGGTVVEAAGPVKDATKKRGALGPFAIISLAYILFTTTDGAVRMIVLLHAYQQGFTALALAGIFSGYELAGVVVNLLAGVAGARWGIKATLLGGLSFQMVALGMLLGWQTSWGQAQAIVYISVSQVLNGVAKDLTKLGGKTVTKLVTPDEKQQALFKLVAWITGFKNSFKGLGYLLGAVLLTVNYYLSIGIMMGLICAALPFAVSGLSWQLGRSERKNVTLRAVFRMNYNVNMLSAARFFLFASRDLWFEVTLPYFLRSPASGIGWGRVLVGLYLAIWIILYGQVQSWSPKFLLKPLGQSPPNKWAAVLWAAVLVACPAAMTGVLFGSNVFGYGVAKGTAVAVMTVILYLFCLVFAVNSAVHSYLIVRYAEGNKVAMNVGFYYMANAGGRLVGTLLSGILYTYVGDSIVQGFGACFAVSVAFVVISAVLASFIHDDVGGLNCGPCLNFRGRAKAAVGRLAEGNVLLATSAV